MFDGTAGQIDAVSRQVSQRPHAGAEAKVATLTQTYDAGIEDVWDACTSAERLPRWFLPVSGELRLGGKYQLEGNAGGEVLECEPPSRFSVTWEYNGEVSWVDVRLSEQAGRTTLVLEHLAHVDDERWNEFGPGAVGVGWDLSLLALRHHLDGAPAVDPKQLEEWYGTADAKKFMTRSSEDWCRAQIESGTPEETARGAADRTTAAYTGTGPSADPAADEGADPV